MLCKKCKTALDEKTKVCPYCGAKANGNAVIIFGMLCVVVAVTAGTVLYIVRSNDSPLATEPPVVEAPAAEAPATTTTEAPQSVVELEQPEDTPELAAEEDQFFEVTPTPTPPPHAADTSKTEDEVWDLLENMAVAQSDYYDRNNTSRVILSKNGYLYNYPAKSYYTPKNFSRVESMKPGYADEQVLLLFVRPDDLKEYLGEGISGSELALFCAYETHDGFAVAQREGRVGVISREDFQKVLALYSDERGGIFRPENDSAEFASVMTGVYRFKSGGEYDVRYLTYDSKYAFVVLSEKSTPEVLEEYVLVKNAGEWSVGLNGFETKFMYQKAVNNQFPDLNIGMLPPYNLYYDLKEVRSNISPLIEAMRTQGVVTEEEGRTAFATGTDKFCYMEFENGKKLLAVYTGTEKGWMVYTINNFLHAELIMAEYDKNPPTFILKQ